MDHGRVLSFFMGSVQFTASFSPSKPHAVLWAIAVD